MLRIIVSASLVIVLLVGGGTVSAAQSPVTALPEALVTALMGSSSRISSQHPIYFVGQVPSGYPAALVPSGPVTLVGGMRDGSQTVAVFADSTRRLAAVFEQLFEAAGYRRPPEQPGRGFSSATGAYRFFCKDSATVSVEPMGRGSLELARVTYRVSLGGCAGFFPQPRSVELLRIPPLTPMPNVRVTSSGGGSGDGVDSRAVVTGDGISPESVLAWYTGQLVQAGWRTGAPAISARVAAQFFDATDDKGGQWQGTLVVSGLNTAMNLALVMRPR